MRDLLRHPACMGSSPKFPARFRAWPEAPCGFLSPMLGGVRGPLPRTVAGCDTTGSSGGAGTRAGVQLPRGRRHQGPRTGTTYVTGLTGVPRISQGRLSGKDRLGEGKTLYHYTATGLFTWISVEHDRIHLGTSDLETEVPPTARRIMVGTICDEGTMTYGPRSPQPQGTRKSALVVRREPTAEIRPNSSSKRSTTALPSSMPTMQMILRTRLFAWIVVQIVSHSVRSIFNLGSVPSMAHDV